MWGGGHGTHMEVRGQHQVLGLIFHLLWDKVFYYSPLYTSGWLVLMLPRILLYATHLAPEALGLWPTLLCPAFRGSLRCGLRSSLLGSKQSIASLLPCRRRCCCFECGSCAAPQADLELSILLPYLSAGITGMLYQTWPFVFNLHPVSFKIDLVLRSND